MTKIFSYDSPCGGIFLAAVLASATTAHAQSSRARSHAENAQQQVGNGDWMAQQSETDSVVLQIDYDQNSNDGTRMESQTLVSLLKSTLLTDPALAKGTGLSIEDARKAVTIDVQQAGGRYVQLSVAIHPGATIRETDPGKKIIQDLCDRLKAAVAQSAKASASIGEARRSALEADLKSAQQRLDDANAQYKYAREHPSTYVNNCNDPRYQLQNLQQQKQQLELQLIGSKARLKVLSEPPAAPTTAPSASPSSSMQNESPMARLIESRTKHLDEIKARAAKNEATPAEVADAEAMLDDARMMSELLQQSPVNRFPRVDFNGVNYSSPGELTQLRATIAESEARLGAINEQIDKINAMAPTPQSDSGVPQDQVNRLQNEQQRRQSDVESIQSLLMDFRRGRGRGAAPIITVLDGNSSPSVSSPAATPPTTEQ